MTNSREKDVSEDSTKLMIRSRSDLKIAHEALDAAQLPVYLSLSPPRASDELTARLHCAIRCISNQILWAGEKLCEEDWKRLLVAGIYGQRVVPSPNGKGFVVLDKRTSRMSGATKYDLVEYIYAFGSERGVVFDDDQ